MRRKLISLALVWTAWHGASAVAGDSFNNGGGLAEANITYVWMTLETYLQTCLTLPGCRGDAADQSLVGDIAAAASAERIASLPRFQTAAAEPGYFAAGGVERAFRTAPERNALVTYNLDKIYHFDATSGTTQPLSVGDALGLVFEALSQHHGRAWDDLRVASVVTRLKDLWASSTQEIHLGGQNNDQIYAQVVTLPSGARLLVSGGSDLVDLTPDFERGVTAFGNLRFGDLQDYGERSVRLPLRGRASGRDFTVLLYFKIDEATRALTFDRDEIRW